MLGRDKPFELPFLPSKQREMAVGMSAWFSALRYVPAGVANVKYMNYLCINLIHIEY